MWPSSSLDCEAKSSGMLLPAKGLELNSEGAEVITDFKV